MKNNVFEGNAYAAYGDDVISHDELASIIADGKTYGSLKESFLRHQEEYGIESIDYLSLKRGQWTLLRSLLREKMTGFLRS